MLELRKNNPSRPVDWRWQRAKQLIERRQGIDRYADDDSVCEARAFCAALSTRRTENQMIKLADDHPDMFQA